MGLMCCESPQQPQCPTANQSICWCDSLSQKSKWGNGRYWWVGWQRIRVGIVIGHHFQTSFSVHFDPVSSPSLPIIFLSYVHPLMPHHAHNRWQGKQYNWCCYKDYLLSTLAVRLPSGLLINWPSKTIHLLVMIHKGLPNGRRRLHLWVGCCSLSSQALVLGTLLCGADETLHTKVGQAWQPGAGDRSCWYLPSTDRSGGYWVIPLHGGCSVNSQLNCGSGFVYPLILPTGRGCDVPYEQHGDHADFAAWTDQDPWGLSSQSGTEVVGTGPCYCQPGGWQPQPPPGQQEAHSLHQ